MTQTHLSCDERWKISFVKKNGGSAWTLSTRNGFKITSGCGMDSDVISKPWMKSWPWVYEMKFLDCCDQFHTCVGQFLPDEEKRQQVEECVFGRSFSGGLNLSEIIMVMTLPTSNDLISKLRRFVDDYTKKSLPADICETIALFLCGNKVYKNEKMINTLTEIKFVKSLPLLKM